MFTKSDYIERRKTVRAAADADVIVVSANGLVQKSADTTFPFRQDSNFLYLTGLDIPEAVVVLYKDGTEYVILPKRLKHRDQWEGALNHDDMRTQSGIAHIYESDEGWNILKKQVSTAKRVGSVLPARSYEPNYGMYINPAKIRFAKKLKTSVKHALVDVRSTFAYVRSVKSAAEIQAIRRAVTITQQSLGALRPELSHMKNERDIEVLLTYEFMKQGAEGHAYDPIIASGVHAATIHYDKNNGALQNGDLVLLDVGAAYLGYAADISRTWAIGAAVTGRQQELFDIVLDVQRHAMSLLRPGTILREYEAQVREYMNAHLVRIGLIKSGDKSASTMYFPHLCSHFLGLDVHDAGVYDKPLEAGMVLTVEPGLYVPEEAIGIRLEDNILITSTGIENLSKDIPSTLLY